MDFCPGNMGDIGGCVAIISRVHGKLCSLPQSFLETGLFCILYAPNDNTHEKRTEEQK